MTIEFVYFDLGKVLLNFDHGRMCRQIAAVSGASEKRVAEVLFEEGLQVEIETGRLSTEEFLDVFCRKTDTKPDRGAMIHAAGDFFRLNKPVLPILASLAHSRRPLGILSNTCEIHWRHCRRRYPALLGLFGVVTLSYEVGVMKPDAAIYRAAAQRAGVPPEAIFFTDDLLQNVEAASAAGFDAVAFTSAGQLAAELRRRGLELNY